MRLILQQKVEIGDKRGLLLGVGFEMTMPQASLAKAQLVQQLAHPFTTASNPTAGIEDVFEQFSRPTAYVVANPVGTLTNHLREGRVINRVQSRRTTWNGGALQAHKTLVVDRMYPKANGFLIMVQALGNLGTGIAIKEQ